MQSQIRGCRGPDQLLENEKGGVPGWILKLGSACLAFLLSVYRRQDCEGCLKLNFIAGVGENHILARRF